MMFLKLRCRVPFNGVWLLPCLVLVLVACGGIEPPHAPKIHDTIAAHQGLTQGPDTAHLTSPLKRVPVQFPGHPEAAAFFVETRLDQLQHAPCGQCHDAPVDLGQTPRAHWDITLAHAGSHVMTCTTCHDAGDHKASLVFLSGSRLSFDHSYQLCGQCHFEQLRDWEGGAHGQRLATWSGDRVVRNCTSCHDPHQPVFHTQWPEHSATPTNQKLRVPDPTSHGEEAGHD